MALLKKKRIVLAVLAVLLGVLLVALGLFWPVVRSAVSVKHLEDGLYAMEYRGDYGLDAFLAQGGASSDSAVCATITGKIMSASIGLTYGKKIASAAAMRMRQLFSHNICSKGILFYSI